MVKTEELVIDGVELEAVSEEESEVEEELQPPQEGDTPAASPTASDLGSNQENENSTEQGSAEANSEENGSSEGGDYRLESGENRNSVQIGTGNIEHHGSFFDDLSRISMPESNRSSRNNLLANSHQMSRIWSPPPVSPASRGPWPYSSIFASWISHSDLIPPEFLGGDQPMHSAFEFPPYSFTYSSTGNEQILIYHFVDANQPQAFFCQHQVSVGWPNRGTFLHTNVPYMYVSPGVTFCSECVDYREYMNSRDQYENYSFHDRQFPTSFNPPTGPDLQHWDSLSTNQYEPVTENLINCQFGNSQAVIAPPSSSGQYQGSLHPPMDLRIRNSGFVPVGHQFNRRNNRMTPSAHRQGEGHEPSSDNRFTRPQGWAPGRPQRPIVGFSGAQESPPNPFVRGPMALQGQQQAPAGPGLVAPRPRRLGYTWNTDPWEPPHLSRRPVPTRPRRQGRDLGPRPTKPNNGAKI